MGHTHGFERLDEHFISETQTIARRYRHLRTGAELLSLLNQDENKVFGITFRTPPGDSTGVAHILEHSVLCGSRKYPVKEPFVELLKGSLKTFLNAMTYPDKTCYPVASQNEQDFYNLIDVYLDAVFHPRLTPHVLQQEGWHLELDDVDGPLADKGVVFSEMKGVYSSPERLLMEYAQQSLFPDHPYGFDSGGDPREIPRLTYEQFKDFHERHYHPSNARIFFYGDGDPDRRLRVVNEYLQDFDRLSVDSRVPPQPRWHEPRQIVRTYAASEAPGSPAKAMLTMNWLLSENGDGERILSCYLLDYLLLGMPASPLRKALIDSGLGEDITGVGLESELRHMYFSTGLKGIAGEDAGRVESLILETLATLSRNGIDPATVEAAVNTVEFRLRENNSGSYPRGLVLMLRALTTWLYDHDPLTLLAFERPLNNVKTILSRHGRYFEDMIEDSFIANAHRTTLLLQPDWELADREAAADRERLAQLKDAMDGEQRARLVEATHTLLRIQEAPDPPEALARIPRLQVEDLNPAIKTIPIAVVHREEVPFYHHDLETSGIVYLDLGLNLRLLPQELLPYVPLFGRALVEMGTAREDYVALTQRISSKTGGITPKLLTAVVRNEPDPAAYLFLRAKCMSPKSEDLLAILEEVLLSTELDNRERFKQMVLEEKARREQALVPSGHQFINLRLRAHFTLADWAAEQMNGVSYVLFLRDLAAAVDRDWPRVLATLAEVHRRLVTRQALLLNLTVAQPTFATVAPRLERLAGNLPDRTAALYRWQGTPAAAEEGFLVPAQVNFVGKGADLRVLGFHPSGTTQVITRHLRTSWLWDRVRVQGGAYGAFCTYNSFSGVLTLVSYRDPNLLATLDAFDASAEFLERAQIGADEISKSIIGTIGEIDTYLLPDAKGFASMVRQLTGNTDEVRQRTRDEILGTDGRDFREFAAVMRAFAAHGVVKLMGGEGPIGQARAEHIKDLEVMRLL
jgi:Zn-dependent M16 (insulinase) family peptidase